VATPVPRGMARLKPSIPMVSLVIPIRLRSSPPGP
jgi:hypothetical protein